MQVKYIKDNELKELDVFEKSTRDYITDSLEPVQTEGLLSLTNIIPNDPIDFLAEYQYSRSFEF